MFQFTSQNETYLTPAELINSLGAFDLDPACPENMPYQTAKVMLTPKEDGLSVDWRGKGRIWLNPPYGRKIATWCDKFAAEADHGILLIFARTDTAYFARLAQVAQHLIFLKGRLRFNNILGLPTKLSAPAPSVMVCKNESYDFLRHWAHQYGHILVTLGHYAI